MAAAYSAAAMAGAAGVPGVAHAALPGLLPHMQLLCDSFPGPGPPAPASTMLVHTQQQLLAASANSSGMAAGLNAGAAAAPPQAVRGAPVGFSAGMGAGSSCGSGSNRPFGVVAGMAAQGGHAWPAAGGGMCCGSTPMGCSNPMGPPAPVMGLNSFGGGSSSMMQPPLGSASSGMAPPAWQQQQRAAAAPFDPSPFAGLQCPQWPQSQFLGAPGIGCAAPPPAVMQAAILSALQAGHLEITAAALARLPPVLMQQVLQGLPDTLQGILMVAVATYWQQQQHSGGRGCGAQQKAAAMGVQHGAPAAGWLHAAGSASAGGGAPTGGDNAQPSRPQHVMPAWPPGMGLWAGLQQSGVAGFDCAPALLTGSAWQPPLVQLHQQQQQQHSSTALDTSLVRMPSLMHQGGAVVGTMAPATMLSGAQSAACIVQPVQGAPAVAQQEQPEGRGVPAAGGGAFGGPGDSQHENAAAQGVAARRAPKRKRAQTGSQVRPQGGGTTPCSWREGSISSGGGDGAL